MTADAQRTLDGRTIPVTPVRRELHVYITPMAFNVTDRAKFLANVPKSAFAESCIKMGGALSRILPPDVLASFQDMPPDRIRETVIAAVVQYLKDNSDFPFPPVF
jgi:hypothetical protein